MGFLKKSANSTHKNLSEGIYGILDNTHDGCFETISYIHNKPLSQKLDCHKVELSQMSCDRKGSKITRKIKGFRKTVTCH